MHTVLELLNLSAEYLQKKGIESPRLNAELMLAGILNCKRLELYLAFDRPLKENEVELYRNYLKRRGNFEPLQYILGEVEFYGLNFKVNPSVLIPRQETEILVETVIKLAGQNERLRILDIGTGSGIIPVTLAKFLPGASFTALDISKEALNTADENARLHQVNEKIYFIEADIVTDKFTAENEYDFVISNPPYVSIDEYNLLQKEIVEHEPRIALTDFKDGFYFYELISAKALKYLKNGGMLVFEAGEGQAARIAEMMSANGYKNILLTKDYLSIERVITGVKK